VLRLIAAAVVDQDDLKHARLARESGEESLTQRRDIVLFVVERDDD
jgi:hypothetical protein